MEILTKNYLTRGFWGDEAWTALISQLSLRKIVATTAQDFHPPFYYFLVHFWIKFFGDSEAAIRSLSVLFWLLTGLVVYKLCLCFWERGRAFLSAIFVLTNPFIFTYACEARSYALLTLLTTTSMFCFLRALRKSKHWNYFYLLVSAAGIYTHYYMWFVILAQGIYVLLFERAFLKRLIPLFLGILLFYLPWLPILFKQTRGVAQDYWIPGIDKRTHIDTFVRLIAGHETGRAANALVLFYCLIFLISFFLWLTKPRRLSRKTGLFLLWFLVPIIAPTLISLYKPVYFYRYLVFVSVPLTLLVCSKRSRKRLFATISIFIFFNLVLDFRIFSKQPFTMREAFSQIYEESQPSDTIFTFLPSFAETAYYSKGKIRVVVSEEGLVQFSGKSLLDAFVKQGRAEIGGLPTGRYWQVEQGPKVTLKQTP